MLKSAYNKPYARIKMTMLSLFVVGLLTGCGIRGGLKTPPPVFGGDTKVDQTRVPTGDLDEENADEDEFFDIDIEGQDTLDDL